MSHRSPSSIPSPLHSPSTLKSMSKFCLSSLASPSDSLFFVSSASPQVQATVTYRGTTAAHPQAHLSPRESLLCAETFSGPHCPSDHVPHPQMMTWKQDTVVWLTCLLPRSCPPAACSLCLNPRYPVTWRVWSFSLPLPLPDNHASPSGPSLASCPQSAQPGSGLS